MKDDNELGMGLEMKVGGCCLNYGDLGAGPTSSSISSQALGPALSIEIPKDGRFLSRKVPNTISSEITISMKIIIYIII